MDQLEMDMVEVLQVATRRVNPPPPGALLTLKRQYASLQEGKHLRLSKRSIKCDSKQDVGVGRRAWEHG